MYHGNCPGCGNYDGGSSYSPGMELPNTTYNSSDSYSSPEDMYKHAEHQDDGVIDLDYRDSPEVREEQGKADKPSIDDTVSGEPADKRALNLDALDLSILYTLEPEDHQDEA